MMNKDRVSNRNSQGEGGGGSTFEQSRCTTYGKQHWGNCLASTCKVSQNEERYLEHNM